MMRNRWLAMLLAPAALLLTAIGCRQINVAEVLQLPEQAKIYTQCNLWYDSDDEISCLNYQSGKIIPLGTEVEIVKAKESYLRFKTVSDGREYRINYDPEWTMIPMETYIREILGDKNRNQLLQGINPDFLKSIDRGIVSKGMTRRDVLLTCGNPAACRTPSLENDTWIYWTGRFSTIRVVYKDGKVMEILSLK
ncbi:MAG: hypothetical protein PHQ27_01995 [Victivallales bacterium]|nr:hypothetical protein [Victivallales bacterium]